MAGVSKKEGADADAAVAALSSDGNLMPEFDGDGKKRIDIGGQNREDVATDIALQPIGTEVKLLVAGVSRGSSPETWVLRLDRTSGEIDASFGSNGRVIVSGTSGPVPRLAVTSNGSFFLLTGGAIHRRLGSGAVDTSFGPSPGGSAPLPIQGTDLALDAQGRIVVAGYVPQSGGASQYAAARLLPSGQLDHRFGREPGRVTYDFGDPLSLWQVAYSLVLHPSSGNIVLIGASQGVSRQFPFALMGLVPSLKECPLRYLIWIVLFLTPLTAFAQAPDDKPVPDLGGGRLARKPLRPTSTRRRPSSTLAREEHLAVVKKTTDLAVGLSAGLSYFFPVLHVQQVLSGPFALGLMPMFAYYKAGQGDILAYGGFLTGNYYYTHPTFRGVFFQGGVGFVHLEAKGSEPAASATPLSVMANVGWRGIAHWDLGLDISVSGGLLLVLGKDDDTLASEFSGLLPIVNVSLGFSL